MNKKFILRTLVLASIGTFALAGCNNDKNEIKVPTSTSTTASSTHVINEVVKATETKTDETKVTETKTDETKVAETKTDLAITATEITAKISNPIIDENLILSFDIDVADENGQHVTGLKTADIGGIALGRIGSTNDVPSMGATQDTKIWLSYFNGADKYNANVSGGYNKFKGESCADESCLIDNGDGTYHVTLKDHPITTAPFKFKYDENKVTGIYLSLSPKNDKDATVIANSFYYWTPSTGKEAANPKTVVENPAAKCNSCHQGNHRHSGKHLSSQACSFCHTAYSKGVYKADKDTNLVSSMYVADLVHANHISFATNCQSCHTADKTNADSDVNLWHKTANNEVCTSCHSNKLNSQYTGFETNHIDQATGKIKREACTSCHTPTSTWAPAIPHQPK
ncbi:hypothetical protein ACFOD0_14690 [Shewanella intestini]|uniref:Cytochrome C n=1 Tax=Shewanella intestini TaxID=2017544 RepID=A0ABS5I6M0_9GAMM|nr:MULTISPECIES: hypothetical protein [Shewanella]MBR9729546.1 hypothetical protein [Shewanella intestini]MRG37513.1 hypothetical protein [Shewanella sp. XMDDZSB0408]